MKKVAFLALVFLVYGKISVAQCGKTTVLSSSKTEYLDGSYAVQRTVEEKSSIEINKSEIIIIPGNEQSKMTGAIKSDSCNWKKPFREGKSVVKATFTREGEDPKNATITIEGKDGKVSFLMEIDEMPDKKIRIMVDKFEEKI